MKRLTVLKTALLAMTTLVATVAIQAQTPCVTPTKHKHTKKVEPCSSAEKQLADLQAQLKAQQAQIDALSAQLSANKPAAAESDPIATPIANQAAADAADAKAKVNGMSSSVADLKSTVAGEQETILATQKKITELESPATIHYKGVSITPGGFLAAESMFRTRATNSDIATPLSAIPYNNSTNAHISEFNGSARQSRLAVLVNAPFSFGKAGGYYEMDFLSAGTTSNNNQTNSYTLRVRSAFGQVLLNNGFSFQGGQMFTLATEVKKGILAGPGAEALPPTIDPNYTVGFNFGRQYALRLAQSFAKNKANVALGIEESQIILAGGSNYPANFVLGGPGAAGGLFNSTGGSSGGGTATVTAAAQNYTDNLAPDVHLKATFDPGYGHYEIGGVLRFFRDRVYNQTCTANCGTSAATLVTSTTGTNYTTPGGGLYASARVPATKYADVALKGYFGPGMARYGASNLGDVTVRPTGQLEPLKTSGGLFELDLHPTKKLDIFFLDGIEYLQRTSYVSPLTGQQVGYAPVQFQNNANCNNQSAPVSASGYGYSVTSGCSGSTRYVAESSGGITYRFFSSPTKGRFQMQLVYSYLDKMSWQGYIGTSYANSVALGSQYFHGAQAINNMFSTSFRYYIP
jgi:hypothetical protein